jgi:hypothetical protein
MTVKPYNCSLYEVMVHRMLILMQFLYTHVTRFFSSDNVYCQIHNLHAVDSKSSSVNEPPY